MFRLLLLFLFLREVCVISSDDNEEVSYCVIANESGHCNCSDLEPANLDRCRTLQNLIKNIRETINNTRYHSVTLNFMPGNHYVNFTERVDITVPVQLNMIGLDDTVRVYANCSCNDSESVVDCGLFFWRSVL